MVRLAGPNLALLSPDSNCLRVQWRPRAFQLSDRPGQLSESAPSSANGDASGARRKCARKNGADLKVLEGVNESRWKPKYRSLWFWPVHRMDALGEAEANEFNSSPFLPNGYYFRDGAARGNSVLPGVDQKNWLQFGRYLAVAARRKTWLNRSALSGQALQWSDFAVNAVPGPQNPWIAPAELNAFRDRYLAMSFEQLDRAFKTTDRPVGPEPELRSHG